MPLFCSLLGFLILGERITKVETVCLVIAFIGIYVLIYYGDMNSHDSKKEEDYSWLPVLMMVLAPILLALTNICLRYMRSLHELTASTYSVVYSVVIFGLIISATQEN